MAKQKLVCRPRSLKIFETAFDNGITPSGQIHTTNYIKGDHLIHHKEWSGMVRGEKQSLACFGKVAAILKVDASTLYYGDAMIEPGDVAIEKLASHGESKLWNFLETTLADAPAHKYVGVVYHLVRQDWDSFVYFRSTTHDKAKNWAAKYKLLVTEFFDLIDAAIKQRTSPTEGQTPDVQPWTQAKQFDDSVDESTVPKKVLGPEPDTNLVDESTLQKKDAETRQSLIEYAENLLDSDQPALKAICRQLGLKDPSSGLAVQKLFPLQHDAAADVHQLSSEFRDFMQLGFAMRKQPYSMPVAILIGLRDIAICMSVPRKDRLDAIRQSLSDSGLKKLPTADLEFARLIVGRALGKLPGRRPDQIPRGAIRARVLAGNENVVELTLNELSGAIAVFDEPADEGSDSNKYLEQFCAGLAQGMGIPCDENDQSLPPAYTPEINSHLKWYANAQVKVCIFVTTERPVDEIPKLKGWFPQLDIVRLADCDPEHYRDLRTGADLFDEAFALNRSTIPNSLDS